MKENSTESNIFVAVRYLSWITASIISAVINIFLFSNLSSENPALLIGMSLTLELTKIITLLCGNIFSSLYKKVRDPFLRNMKTLFYFIYGCFAILAIVASVSFSLVITNKNDETYSTQKEALQQQLKDIESFELKIESFEKNELSKSKAAEAEESKKYKEANDLDSEIKDRMTQIERSTDEWKDLYNRTLSKTLRATLEKNKEDAQSKFEEDKKTFEKMKSDLTETFASYGYKNKSDLLIKISQTNAEEISNSGSLKMFYLLSKIVPFDPNSIRFSILLFVSILIELTILIASPCISINKTILRYFKDYIPSSIDIDEIIKKFEEENLRFVYKENLKLSREERKLFNQKVEDGIDKKMKKVTKSLEQKEAVEKELKELRNKFDKLQEENRNLIISSKEIPAEIIEAAPQIEKIMQEKIEKKPRKPRVKKEFNLPEITEEIEAAPQIEEIMTEKKPRKTRVKKAIEAAPAIEEIMTEKGVEKPKARKNNSSLIISAETEIKSLIDDLSRENG
jgi:hypothetical protein